MSLCVSVYGNRETCHVTQMSKANIRKRKKNTYEGKKHVSCHAHMEMHTYK